MQDSYSYDPLGNATSSGSVPNPFTFQGWSFDSQTGFYYTGGGYYDPATGRSFGCKDSGRWDPGEDNCGEDPDLQCGGDCINPLLQRTTVPFCDNETDQEDKCSYPTGEVVGGPAWSEAAGPQSVAEQVTNEIGGEAEPISGGKGWRINIPFRRRGIVVRIMEAGSGGRDKPYFRVSIAGTKAFTVEGANRALTRDLPTFF